MQRSEEKIIGRVSSRQLLDYYLLDELMDGQQRGYSARVSARLAQSNIKMSSQVVYARAKNILSGKTTVVPSADVNGTPSARIGKDQNYAGFWTMVDLAIPFPETRKYVGLPANQIDVVRERVASPGSLVVCEMDATRADKFFRLAQFLHEVRPGPRIEVEVEDIFRVMDRETNRFNIFDLDLMCCLPKSEELESWAKIIYKSALPGKSVVNLTATVGRGITDKEHLYRSTIFRDMLQFAGFEETGASLWSYRDRQIPMRATRLILNKTS